ncbi:MAG: Asp23/Gls24 family envelope stress response protein [Erysipelotrichaceae bacterium]|nr:Asp23/Gls24 family envelope stress response protein [Erysipelotrichaceae bacterium]MDD3808720.1 Asp23/Gls24 family envelope stress response protein [Erysipelotrichaceae bacterium]
MSMEYYQLEKENNYGIVNISQNVFATIAQKAVKDLDGVELAGNVPIRVPGGSNSIDVEISKNNQVNVKLDVLVNYGLNVSNIVHTLQSKIYNDASQMTGIKNILVNIDVRAIKF